MAYSMLHFTDPETGGRAEAWLTAEDGGWVVRLDAASPGPAPGQRVAVRWAQLAPYLGWAAPALGGGHE